MSLSTKIFNIGFNLLLYVLPAPITARLTFSFGNLGPVLPLRSIAAHTINYKDRWPFECISPHFVLKGSEDAIVSRIQEAFCKIVKGDSCTIIDEYPIHEIEGINASKSNLSLYKSVDDFGEASLGMRDLTNVSDEVRIDICKNWAQSDLDSEQHIHWDNWSLRRYWMNNGGSHHTAVLIYLLKKYNRKFNVKARLCGHFIDLSPLKELNAISFYVVRSLNCQIDSVVTFRNSVIDTPSEVKKSLGVSAFNLTQALGLTNERPYWLIAVDRNAIASSHALSAIQNKIAEGSAMTFENFIQISPYS